MTQTSFPHPTGNRARQLTMSVGLVVLAWCGSIHAQDCKVPAPGEMVCSFVAEKSGPGMMHALSQWEITGPQPTSHLKIEMNGALIYEGDLAWKGKNSKMFSHGQAFGRPLEAGKRYEIQVSARANDAKLMLPLRLDLPVKKPSVQYSN